MRIFALFFVPALMLASTAQASPIVLEGNYLKFGISDYGTLGSGGSTSPGLLHDPTGKKNFGVNDYITPGSPHEGFTLHADQFGPASNDNIGASSFGTSSPTLLTGAAAMGYALAAAWTGENRFVSVTNSYFTNVDSQIIEVVSKITALQDLTNLAFGRSVDPDPDVNTTGDYSTNNQRGNSLYGTNDFVGAAGASTGLTLALVNRSGGAYKHGTQINGACCSNIDPYNVLANPGPLTTTGDDGLNMAWLTGSLASGESATIRYAYAVGDKIGSVGDPTGAVPELGTWAMMVFGVGLIGGVARRQRSRGQQAQAALRPM